MMADEIISALMEKLRNALPDVQVRKVFTGYMTRQLVKSLICVGIIREERTESGSTMKLGVWLYTPKPEQIADLFETVCAALDALPCAVHAVTHGETEYNASAGCMQTACVIEVSAAASSLRTEKLRFGDFVFQNAPESVQIDRKAPVHEYVTIFGEEYTEQVGMGRRRVSGKGRFLGKDAMEQYRELEKHFGETHTLFLPGQEPFPAILSDLSLSGAPSANAAVYRFDFVETGEMPAGLSGRIYLAAEGESLWDYAYFAGVSIDAMVQANPHIECIGTLQEGEAVYIP